MWLIFWASIFLLDFEVDSKKYYYLREVYLNPYKKVIMNGVFLLIWINWSVICMYKYWAYI